MSISGSGGGRELPRPVPQAMLVCDQVIRDAETDRLSLIGIIDHIAGADFPLTWVRPITVYARGTDAVGNYEVRLELVRLEDERSIGRLDGHIAIGDRMSFSNLIFDLDLLVFEGPGRYEFRLFAGGRHVGGVAFSVIQIDERLGGSHG